MTSLLKGVTSPKVLEFQEGGAGRARYSSNLREAGFLHGFSLRGEGSSVGAFESLNLGRAIGDEPAAVAANHASFAETVGYSLSKLYEVSQVHGARVRAIRADESPQAVRVEEADALVTGAAGVAVGVRTADCVPILLADPVSGAVAAVHSGWRGTAAGVVERAVEALCELAGAPAGRLLAAIGPHIRVGSFEVGREVAEQIQALVPHEPVIRQAEPRPFACLSTVIHYQLRSAGLSGTSVEDIGGCTFEDAGSYFSYRRDGGRTGRHLAAIVAR